MRDKDVLIRETNKAIYAEKTLASKLGQVRLERTVGQNEVRPSDERKTNDLGYLLARGNWNKVSEIKEYKFKLPINIRQKYLKVVE